SHKNDFGHILVIGGGPGMPGAVCLTAKAAMRSGGGSVTIATWPDHAQAMVPFIPEAMITGVRDQQDLISLLTQATVCVIGPGLGETAWAKSLFLAALTSQLPMIIDASALRLLAQHPQLDDNWVLTPHPGEAACLLACSSSDIQQDRYHAIKSIQQQYGGVVILKGAGSIIQTVDKNTYVCNKGNPGMASAGMGDVLSGIIAGFIAQGLSLSQAAQYGVWVHALAGDKIAQTVGEIGILASDLINIIPDILNCNKI
ncbi:MAG: NAD(P)H-hydrate dehydratase, partial [bacterium]|nr:NAD(P)H-hydrate dehydratase [bacterium]